MAIGPVTIYPIAFHWDGESMIPLNPRLADRYYVVGETYRLEPREDRSQISHNHYFASIKEAHQNLPEHLAERFATPDHLRKFALIKAGYRDERSVICASKAEAQRVAAFIRPLDDFAVVVASECVVTIYTAKSQSLRAQGKKDFQRIKDRVLDIVSAMIGVGADDLKKNVGKAA